MVALGVPAIPLRASDPVPVQSAPTDDSIATAKRQLDGFKADAAARMGDIPRDALPTVSLPQLGAPAPSLPSTSSNSSADQRAAAKRKSANWLVDAMMTPKENATRTGDRNVRRSSSNSEPRAFGDDESNPDDDMFSDENSGLQTGTSEKRRRDTSSAADRPKETKDTFNPLAQYMTNWLAPQDYALLHRAADVTPNSDPATSGAGNTLPTVSGDAAFNVALPGFDLGGHGNDRTAVAPVAKPTENPYLQFLSPPESSPANFQPPAQAPVYVPQPLPEQVAPPSSASTSVPDFVRPANDDKYFKPLKRF